MNGGEMSREAVTGRRELERLQALLEQRDRELEALAEINRAIARPPQEPAGSRPTLRPRLIADAELPGALLERIVEEAGKLVHADGAGIALVRDGHDGLEVGPAYGPMNTVPGRRLPLRGSITGRVVRTGNAAVIPDVTQDPDWFPLRDSAPPGSAMVVPLRAGSARLGGLVVVRAAGQPAFALQERDVLQRFADQAAIAIQQRLLVRQLEEENRRKEEFVATLSHELRTPLAGILLWNDILRSDPAASQLGASADAFPVITQSAEMLLAMMNDLLDLGRIEAGKLSLERRPADVTVIARQALVAFPRGDEEGGVVLVDDLLDSLPAVYVDPVRIQQVVSNLLSNAVKFTDAPGQVSIRAEAASDGATVAVSVADTGPGIAPEVLPHIFERFRQGETTPDRRRGGLGIGLTLARALVEAHEGVIRVKSEPGKGSTFTFEVPVATEVDRGWVAGAATATGVHRPAQAGTCAESSTAPPQATGGSATILVAEDVDKTRQALLTVLSARGYHVLEAGDGEEALRVAEAERPDAVLMDVAMPKLDGLSALQRLRQDPSTATIPVAAVTARAMPDDRRRIEAAGFDAHLVKPFRIVELVETLEQLLATRNAPA